MWSTSSGVYTNAVQRLRPTLSTDPNSPTWWDYSAIVDTTNLKDISLVGDAFSFEIHLAFGRLCVQNPVLGQGDCRKLQKIFIKYSKIFQEFWVFFMELPKPSELNDNENKQGFTLCRAGVRPEWEDPELKEGGTWTFLLDKKRYVSTRKRSCVCRNLPFPLKRKCFRLFFCFFFTQKPGYIWCTVLYLVE